MNSYRIILVIILAYVFAEVAMAESFTYDVDFPSSPKKGYEMVCITVEKCETCTLIDSKKLFKFSKDGDELSRLAQNAYQRYHSGCKN